MNIKKKKANGVCEVPRSSGIVNRITRYLICIISSSVVVFFVEEVSAELLLKWYMKANQIIYRSDLSEDYGFGMLGFFCSIITVVICFPLSFFISWKILKKYYR